MCGVECFIRAHPNLAEPVQDNETPWFQNLCEMGWSGMLPRSSHPRKVIAKLHLCRINKHQVQAAGFSRCCRRSYEGGRRRIMHRGLPRDSYIREVSKKFFDRASIGEPRGVFTLKYPEEQIVLSERSSTVTGQWMWKYQNMTTPLPTLLVSSGEGGGRVFSYFKFPYERRRQLKFTLDCHHYHLFVSLSAHFQLVLYFTLFYSTLLYFTWRYYNLWTDFRQLYLTFWIAFSTFSFVIKLIISEFSDNLMSDWRRLRLLWFLPLLFASK